MSPSWKVHRTIGEIVCKFSNCKIDGLIDSSDKHDAGRYDKNILSEQIDYVWERWKWNGVCYYLLHHIIDRIADIIVSELCKLCEDYLLGKITVEVAYRELLKNVRQRIKNDYYIQGLWNTGHSEKDELLKHTVSYILVSLEAGWEMCVGFIILDVSATGKPTTGMRVLHGLTVKSVARQFKGFAGFDEQEIKDFLIRIGKIAQKKMEEFEVIAKNREDKLAREYEKLMPKLEKALDKLSSK